MKRLILVATLAATLAGCNAPAPMSDADRIWLITQKSFHKDCQKLDTAFTDLFDNEMFDYNRDHYEDYTRLATLVIEQKERYDRHGNLDHWCGIVRKRIEKQGRWALGEKRSSKPLTDEQVFGNQERIP